MAAGGGTAFLGAFSSVAVDARQEASLLGQPGFCGDGEPRAGRYCRGYFCGNSREFSEFPGL